MSDESSEAMVLVVVLVAVPCQLLSFSFTSILAFLQLLLLVLLLLLLVRFRWDLNFVLPLDIREFALKSDDGDAKIRADHDDKLEDESSLNCEQNSYLARAADKILLDNGSKSKPTACCDKLEQIFLSLA